MTDYAAARLHMVESQLRTNKITDQALIDAFLAIPRENFVPNGLKGVAYIDEDIKLAAGRYMMEPMILARLLQAASIDKASRVLIIGCGLGYGAALLAQLAGKVVAVEEDAALASIAVDRLKQIDCLGVTFVQGSLKEGALAQGPYDVILIEGAVEAVPEQLGAQLVEGGHLVTVLRESGSQGRAVLMTRVGSILSRRVICDAATPVLKSFAVEPSFVF